MQLRHVKRIGLFGLITLLAGCGGGDSQPDVLQEEVVRIPVADIRFDDVNFSNCVFDGSNANAIYVDDIKEISCNDKGIDDITGLEQLTHLETVRLSRNNISDISAIGLTPSIKTLFISSNAGISNIGPLQSLKNINNLFMSGNNVSDLSSLGTLSTLKVLEIYNLESASDLSPIGDLNELTILKITGAVNVADFSALESLTNLFTLSISNSGSVNVPSLDVLPDLRRLSFVGNNMTDVSQLSSLTNLLFLDLSYSNVTTGVSSLSALLNVNEILLVGNQTTMPCVDLVTLQSAIPEIVTPTGSASGIDCL